MILVAFIVWLLAHAHPRVHWAADTWSWMCHHVLLTILICLVGA